LESSNKSAKDTERAIEGDLMERGACNGVIREKQARLRELESANRRHNATESKQLLAQRRLNAAREVIERITDSKQRFEAKFRVDLTKKVRALFDQISFTPYVPEITED
jgi:DNA sulfur modification protein DndD